jgi:hypothetical protein
VHYQRNSGVEEGRKDRPCVILVAVERQLGGDTVVVALPVTHSESKRDAKVLLERAARASSEPPKCQTEIWRPISTTCSPGRLKKSVKWAALRSIKANKASCQRGRPLPSWRLVTVSCPTK